MESNAAAQSPQIFREQRRPKAVTGCLQLTAWKWTLDFVLRLVNGAD